MQDLEVLAEKKLKKSRERHQSHDEMLRRDWLDAVDLSKTSCSQTALNECVLDGFVYNILTRQDVVDKSVSGLYERICLRYVVDTSVGGETRHGCGVS